MKFLQSAWDMLFTAVSTFGLRLEAMHTWQPRPLPRTGDEPADFKVSRVPYVTRDVFVIEADAQSCTSQRHLGFRVIAAGERGRLLRQGGKHSYKAGLGVGKPYR